VSCFFVEKGRTTFIELECNACHSIGDIKHVAAVKHKEIFVEIDKDLI
jgi:hypothetical protein